MSDTLQRVEVEVTSVTVTQDRSGIEVVLASPTGPSGPQGAPGAKGDKGDSGYGVTVSTDFPDDDEGEPGDVWFVLPA